MPRRPRVPTAGLVYHALNRRVGRLPLFETKGDYAAFERTLEEAIARGGIRLMAYCVMPNHWHLLLWPRADEELSETLRWLTVTHTQCWHAFHGTVGTGPLYQGRFKSVPAQSDEHFLAVARYVATSIGARQRWNLRHGDARWQARTAKRLSLESTLRPRGRPRTTGNAC